MKVLESGFEVKERLVKISKESCVGKKIRCRQCSCVVKIEKGDLGKIKRQDNFAGLMASWNPDTYVIPCPTGCGKILICAAEEIIEERRVVSSAKAKFRQSFLGRLIGA